MRVSRLRFGNLRVTLRQDDDSANWHFCCYISKEKKQHRQSTKTAVLKDAEQVAQNIVVDILSKQRSGQKVFSVTLAEARRDWLLHLDKRIGVNPRSTHNAVNQLTWGLKYLEHCKITTNTSIDAIQSTIWKDYPSWRHTAKPTSLTVIHQELVSIRSFFKHAKSRGWVTDTNIPVIETSPEREAPKRRRVTSKEITDSLKAIGQWAAKDWAKRQMFIVVLDTMLNTGMRTGEVLQLRGKDVEVAKNQITIHIAKSKTGRSRTITVWHSGTRQFSNWLLAHPTEPDQLIFPNTFYQHLKQLRKDKVVAKDFDPYHLRHGFATTQINKGESLHLIAKHMGTSTTMIEKTYSNVITAMIGKQFSKTKLEQQEDGTFEVIKRQLGQP
jgi:integrase